MSLLYYAETHLTLCVEAGGQASGTAKVRVEKVGLRGRKLKKEILKNKSGAGHIKPKAGHP